MRKVFLVAWLLLPALGAAYHYGPGQERLLLDDVGRKVAAAEAAVKAGDFKGAEKAYSEALATLPPKKVKAARRLRLERAKTQMQASKLPTAHNDLEVLLKELEDDSKADKKLLDETRSALANSKYYMTWLMRLEGQPKEKWEPMIEAARQNYRILAEKAESKNASKLAKKNREDLEASIRLARMDLSDLQGLPLPSQ